MKTISGTEAIQMMRELSKLPNKHFSLIHFTYNRNKLNSTGKKYVERSVCRASLPEDTFEVSGDLYFPYKDLDSGENKMCWKILLRLVAFPPDFEFMKINWFK